MELDEEMDLVYEEKDALRMEKRERARAAMAASAPPAMPAQPAEPATPAERPVSAAAPDAKKKTWFKRLFQKLVHRV